MKDGMRSFTPWMRLVRLPNLLTVPGDPVAGFLLVAAAGGGAPGMLALAAAMGASLCLYVFGLILNDIVDIEVDRVERPDRPLPSGEITVPQARMAAIAMALSGLNLALVAGRPALYVAAVLAGLIVIYNGVLKGRPVVGVAAMGLCRGASLLLGAVAAMPGTVAGAAPALVAAAGLAAYVMAFSAVAKREMEAEKPQGAVRWMPFVTLLLTLPVVLIVAAAIREPLPFQSMFAVFLMVMTLMRAWFLGGMMYQVQPVPETVGGHIRNLLMAQACLCAAAGQAGALPALTFVLLSFVFQRLSRRFYSS